MRLFLVALVTLTLLAQMSCFYRSSNRQRRWLTGTCPGACDYYAYCKERSGKRVSNAVHQSCNQECDEVFSSSQSILAFESLVCEDAIAFVEGPTGRAPGEPLRQ